MRPILDIPLSMLLLFGAVTGCRRAAGIGDQDTGGAHSQTGGDTDGGPEYLTRRYPGPCEAYTVSSDPADRSPEPFRQQWFTYDEGGWLAHVATDSGADGTLDRQVWYVNDAAGQVLLHEADDTGDGVVNWRFRYEFDASGREIMSARDGEGDGVYERSTRTEYDNAGNVVSVETDSNGDGIINSFCYTTIDGFGNPALCNCNDVVHRWINTYDERGNLVHSAYDARDDGAVDSASEYTYDGDDRLIEESQTSTYDTGTEQSVKRYAYDDHNRLVQTTSSTTSSHGASSDNVTTMAYFDSGNLAGSQTVSSGISNGLPFFKTATSDYSEEGALVRYESTGYYNGATSGALERYRDDGRPLEITRFDTAGPYNSATTYAYDGYGNLTSTTEDLPSGLYYTEYTYGCFE